MPSNIERRITEAIEKDKASRYYEVAKRFIAYEVWDRLKEQVTQHNETVFYGRRVVTIATVSYHLAWLYWEPVYSLRFAALFTTLIIYTLIHLFFVNITRCLSQYLHTIDCQNTTIARALDYLTLIYHGQPKRRLSGSRFLDFIDKKSNGVLTRTQLDYPTLSKCLAPCVTLLIERFVLEWQHEQLMNE